MSFRILALLSVSALLVAGCGESGDDTTTSTTAGGGGAATTATTDEEEPTSTTAEEPKAEVEVSSGPEPQRFTATVANGLVEGGSQRWKAEQGAKVTIVVKSDTDDEIHVHGYDETADISGGSGKVTFTADMEGVYEVELEGSHLPVGTLEVS